MNMLRILPPVLLFLALLVPQVASAEPLIDEYVDTAPVSRNYVDPVTLLEYSYDAQTGVLTPLGTVASNKLGYGALDIYPYGVSPSVWTTDIGACTREFCVSAVAAFVGSHTVTVRVTDYSNWCAPWFHSYSTTGAAVTFMRYRLNVDGWCGGGWAAAYLYVSGTLWTSDSTYY